MKLPFNKELKYHYSSYDFNGIRWSDFDISISNMSGWVRISIKVFFKHILIDIQKRT